MRQSQAYAATNPSPLTDIHPDQGSHLEPSQKLSMLSCSSHGTGRRPQVHTDARSLGDHRDCLLLLLGRR